MMKQKMEKFLIVFVVGVPLVAQTFVEKYITSTQFDSCVSQHPSTYGYVECVNKELQLQDKRLNKNYKRLIRILPKEKRKSLKDTQRVWIKYIEKKCGYFYDRYSGSGGLQDAISCKLKETIKRANELEALY